MKPGWGRLFSQVTAVVAVAVSAGCASTAAPTTASLTTGSSQQTAMAAPGTSAGASSSAGSSQQSAGQQSAGQQASGSGQPITVPKPATSAPPTTVRSVTDPARATSAPAPPTRVCTTADLALTGADEVRSQDGSEGDWVARFSLQNTSGSACRLNGWPGLVFYGEDVIDICVPPGVSGPSCPPPADHTTPQPISVTRAAGSPRDVLLAPGTTTVFAVLWTYGSRGFCQSDKPMLDPYGVHVLVPGDSQPLTLLFDGLNHMQICGQAVQVTAFGAAG